MNDFKTTITKQTIINQCYGGEYRLIYGRILNPTTQRFKRFRFVLSVFYNEIAEYCGGGLTFTKADKKRYIDDLIFSFTETINGYNDCAAFYDACNETITRYNEQGKNVTFMY